MKKIIGVYNADGGLIGEFKYIFEKIFRQKHCALCDITHGYSFVAKKKWNELVKAFPIELETLHLNEVDETLIYLVKDNAPCVIYIDDDQKTIIFSSHELQELKKDPEVFFEKLEEKLKTGVNS